MFRVSSALARATRSVPQCRMMGTYKTSTGLVGLAVDPNGRETLLDLASSIKEAVKPIPATAQYRIDVEKWFNYIGKTCESTRDIKKIEDEISLGQIEEVIAMAKDELELIGVYIEQKGWEQVAEEQRTADAMIADMADTIYFTNPLPPPPAEEEEKK